MQIVIIFQCKYLAQSMWEIPASRSTSRRPRRWDRSSQTLRPWECPEPILQELGLRCLYAKVRTTERISRYLLRRCDLVGESVQHDESKTHEENLHQSAYEIHSKKHRFEYYSFAAELFSLCLYVCVNVYMNLCVCMLDDFFMNVYTYNFNAIYLCMYVPRFLIAYKYG